MPAQKHKKTAKLNAVNKKTTIIKSKSTSSGLKIIEDENNISKKRPSDDNTLSCLLQPRKRTAFGDLTNAVGQNEANTTSIIVSAKPPLLKLTTAKNKSTDKKKKSVVPTKKRSLTKIAEIVTSNSEASTELDSAYLSLSPDSLSTSSSQSSVTSVDDSQLKSNPSSPLTSDKEDSKQDGDDKNSTEVKKEVTTPVLEYDLENLADPNQAAHYAQDIFMYLRSRESQFQLTDYMKGQVHISPSMRAILVDWMVEVQENFELNHETLYLAVKICDHFLMNQFVSREKLQLVGSTALFIACKFDERNPPVIDDFIFICDDAYNRTQLIKMEMTVLKSLNFDLGIPLSYRFLRRFARVARASMQTLTLARYVLELSLLEYKFVTVRDSVKSAAALFLAMKMDDLSRDWTPDLCTASGLKREEFVEMAMKFNEMLKSAGDSHLKTIHSKYSHRIFFEVAKMPPLESSVFISRN